MKQGQVFLGILGFSLLALAVAVYFPAQKSDVPTLTQSLPWQIEVTDDGSIRVFDLVLEQSTINDAIHRFQESAEVSLFVSPENTQVIEVYFNNTRLAGLRAKLVLAVSIDKTQLAAIYDRGTRISTLGDGSRKVTLHPDDLLRVKQSKIASITYLPKTRLDTELLQARFGEPGRRIRETKTTTLHWLYPDLGLDIAQDQDGRTVLQYLPPTKFEQIIQPLLEQGKEELN